MPLADKLGSFKTVHRGSAPLLVALKEPVADRRGTGPAGGTVGVGDLIALPILTGTDGHPFDLGEAAAGRPVVLVVTRSGPWPSCRAALEAYAEARPRIEAAGGVLIAMTSDQPGCAEEMARQDDLRFPVAIDVGRRFAASLGLVAAAPAAVRDGGIGRSGQGPACALEASQRGPILATYVLAPCGRVTWADLDDGISDRAHPDEVVGALRRLAASAADRRRTAADDAAAWESIR